VRVAICCLAGCVFAPRDARVTDAIAALAERRPDQIRIDPLGSQDDYFFKYRAFVDGDTQYYLCWRAGRQNRGPTCCQPTTEGVDQFRFEHHGAYCPR
jgi:hypothetical protein